MQVPAKEADNVKDNEEMGLMHGLWVAVVDTLTMGGKDITKGQSGRGEVAVG